MTSAASHPSVYRRPLSRWWTVVMVVVMSSWVGLPGVRSLSSGGVAMVTRETAVRVMEEAQRDMVERIAGSLELSPVVGWAPSLPSLGVGRVSAFEAAADATKPLVSWASWCTVPAASSSQVTAWCGPLTDVPHLVLRLAVDDDGRALSVVLDFRPRLDAGYDEADRPPASRAAFVRAGVRRGYDAIYFTPEARQWRLDAAAVTGAVDHDARPTARVLSRAGTGSGDWSPCHGPLYLHATLPPTQSSLDYAVRLCHDATDRWLGWVRAASTDTDQASKWMTSRLVYDRDNQLRAALFSAAAQHYADLLQDDATARTLALADTGRLDMIGHNDIGRGEGDFF